MSNAFRKFSNRMSTTVGSPYAFLIAVAVVIVWAVTGPVFEYSNTWQLAINTGTTIITFLMVFLIQNTQNRDTKAVHIKLDELIKSTTKARDSMVDIENLSDEELSRFQEEFRTIREKAERELEKIEKAKAKKRKS